MSKFKTICEMDAGSIINTMLGIQPMSNVGKTGKICGVPEKNVTVKPLDCGGVEVMSQDLSIKLSKEVYEAIKEFIQGETENA